jgi:nitroreductase
MLNDNSSALALLRTRRSGRPRDMVAPGPSPDELRDILQIGMRVPDHGKLSPWRFVHVRPDQRAQLERLLHAAYREANGEAGKPEADAVARIAHQAPCLVVVLSSPVEGTKIPVWEQHLSAGAACMNILHAAHAMGYVAGWITGWPTYSETVRRAFAQGAETIAAFIYIGSPGHPLEERPRPDYARVVSDWTPPLTE